MAEVPVGIKFVPQQLAWFTANSAEIFPAGIVFYCNEAPNKGHYKLTDGVTALGALTFLGGGGGGGGLVDSVVGTADRITVDNTDPENPIIDIDSAYDSAIIAEIAAAILGINKVPLIHQPSAAFSPLDSQHYYFGMSNIAATNAAGNTATYVREVGCPINGTIIACIISAQVTNGATCSNEAVSLYFRNTTAASLSTVTTTWNYATGANIIKTQVVTGLNISVTQGDLTMSVIGNPVFATNPSGVLMNVTYIIES